MPLRTVRDQTHATFGFSAGWTDITTIWGILAGHAKFASSGSAVCTITLPSNHGFTHGVLLGFGYGAGTKNAVVDVDGTVVHAAWNQKFGTSVDSHYYLPRICSFPFLLNPAKGSNQLIHLTGGSDGGFTFILGCELFTAAAPVAGRVVRTGHSMEVPVIDSSTLGPNTSGHGQLFVSYLNATQYLGLTNWTDVNQAVPSEDLTNGSASSGLAGGPNGAGLYTQFANSVFYDNTAILTPAWMRYEAGDTWPNTGGHAPRLGTALITTDAQYMAGVAQWWAQLFNLGIFFHNFNDGYDTLYDDPFPDLPANGASALKTIFTVTAGSPAPTTTFTLSDGTHSVVLSPLSDIPTMNAAAVSASFPYTFVTNSGHGTGVSALAIAGDVITGTENTQGVSAVTRTVNANNGGVTVATTQVGRVKTAAGPNYTQDKFTARFREAMIRVACAITPCPRVYILGYPNSANGGQMNSSAATLRDNAIQSVLAEPWIPAVTGGNPFVFVPLIGAMTGFPSNVSASPFDPHPNTAGHRAIFDELRRAHDRTQANAYVPTTSYRAF